MTTNVLAEFASSRWLGAGDLTDDLPVTITGYSRETVKDSRTGQDLAKLCLRLHGASKPLLLNKTNVKALAKVLGVDPEGWIGATALLYVTETSMGDGIRFRAIKAKATKPKAAAGEPNDAIDDVGGDGQSAPF